MCQRYPPPRHRRPPPARSILLVDPAHITAALYALAACAARGEPCPLLCFVRRP